MNAVDLYEYDGTIGTRTPQEQEQTSNNSGGQHIEESSLNDEVNQVMGQLGRLWGGFRKQSMTAFETARKEVGQAVTSAHKELEKRLSDGMGSTTDETVNPEQSDSINDSSSATPTNSGPSISTKANLLLSRFQSTLPPNLTENLHKRLHDAQDNPTVQQMRATVTSGFTRLQEQTKGMSLSHAEEFVQQRGEALLKEAGEFFKDAVKILPPDDSRVNAPDMVSIWDGSDSWMLAIPEHNGNEDMKGKQQGSSVSIAGNRRSALLRKLRTESSILLLDPTTESNASVGAMFEKWKYDMASTKGEINSHAWSEDRQVALSEDGGALSELHDQLVPSELSDDTFWTRYFFRVHQIEQDEMRRKALFDERIAEKEEDFSWEDDEEEKMSSVTTPTTRADTGNQIVPSEKLPSEPTKTATAPTSPHLSEDSYDHLSQVSGMASRMSPNAEARGKGRGQETEEDGDSDWE